jgi:hypothetical protein
MEPKGKNIECKVVKVLMSQEAGGFGENQLRIVRWIVDGKDTGALLEKRNLYTTKDGQDRMGKAKGFNRADVAFVVENWKEIQTLL